MSSRRGCSPPSSATHEVVEVLVGTLIVRLDDSDDDVGVCHCQGDAAGHDEALVAPSRRVEPNFLWPIFREASDVESARWRRLASVVLLVALFGPDQEGDHRAVELSESASRD